MQSLPQHHNHRHNHAESSRVDLEPWILMNDLQFQVARKQVASCKWDKNKVKLYIFEQRILWCSVQKFRGFEIDDLEAILGSKFHLKSSFDNYTPDTQLRTYVYR